MCVCVCLTLPTANRLAFSLRLWGQSGGDLCVFLWKCQPKLVHRAPWRHLCSDQALHDVCACVCVCVRVCQRETLLLLAEVCQSLSLPCNYFTSKCRFTVLEEWLSGRLSHMLITVGCVGGRMSLTCLHVFWAFGDYQKLSLFLFTVFVLIQTETEAAYELEENWAACWKTSLLIIGFMSSLLHRTRDN